jgi:tRNA-specific adenosine deaminase 1
MSNIEDAIANAVLEVYESLPIKCKPRQRGNGVGEWVPLAGIVLSQGILTLN